MANFAFEDDQWLLAAKCYGNTSLFFSPDESETRGERRAREAQAKSVCQECQVRTECLERALEADEQFGIWGGMTERERRALKRAQRTATGTSAGSGRLLAMAAPPGGRETT
jgi:WhiB family transcriptional regulator, redox-sensing transcriptional regulator